MEPLQFKVKRIEVAECVPLRKEEFTWEHFLLFLRASYNVRCSGTPTTADDEVTKGITQKDSLCIVASVLHLLVKLNAPPLGWKLADGEDAYLRAHLKDYFTQELAIMGSGNFSFVREYFAKVEKIETDAAAKDKDKTAGHVALHERIRETFYDCLSAALEAILTDDPGNIEKGIVMFKPSDAEKAVSGTDFRTTGYGGIGKAGAMTVGNRNFLHVVFVVHGFMAIGNSQVDILQKLIRALVTSLEKEFPPDQDATGHKTETLVHEGTHADKSYNAKDDFDVR